MAATYMTSYKLWHYAMQNNITCLRSPTSGLPMLESRQSFSTNRIQDNLCESSPELHPESKFSRQKRTKLEGGAFQRPNCRQCFPVAAVKSAHSDPRERRRSVRVLHKCQPHPATLSSAGQHCKQRAGAQRCGPGRHGSGSWGGPALGTCWGIWRRAASPTATKGWGTACGPASSWLCGASGVRRGRGRGGRGQGQLTWLLVRRSEAPRGWAPPGPSAAAGCARLRPARSGSAALRPAAHLRRGGRLSLAAGPRAAPPARIPPPMSASHPPVLSPQQDAATVAKSSAKRRRELMAGAVGWSLRALAVPPCCPHCFYSPGTVAAWGFPGCGVGPGRGSCFVFSTCFDRSRAGGGSGALGTRSTCCGTRRGHPALPSQPT